MQETRACDRKQCILDIQVHEAVLYGCERIYPVVKIYYFFKQLYCYYTIIMYILLCLKDIEKGCPFPLHCTKHVQT